MGVHRASHHLVRRPVVGQVVNLRRIGNPPAALGRAAATFGESVSTVCGLPLCGAACQAARDLEDTPASGAPRGLPTRPVQRVSLPTARGLTFLGGLGTLAVFRPALLLRRRDALARRRAQDALATGWLRRRGRGRRE